MALPTLVRSDCVTIGIFARPILRWSGIADQFIEMLYQSLSPSYNISPDDFHVTLGDSPGATRIRYNIFGGSSSIVLSSKDISGDFKNLSQSDFPILFDINQKIEETFLTTFPDFKISEGRNVQFSHYKIPDGSIVGDVISRVAGDAIKWEGATSVNIEKSIRFKVTSTDGMWSGIFTVDRSLLVGNGLYIHFDFNRKWPSGLPPFVERQASANDIVMSFFKAAGLEMS